MTHRLRTQTFCLSADSRGTAGLADDGVEMTAGFFASKFFPNLPLREVAIKAREAAAAQGMQIFGANVWWCFDCGWEDGSIVQEMRDQVKLTKLMGGEYVSFQVWLSPDHCGDAGSVKHTPAISTYLSRQTCFDRVECLHWRVFSVPARRGRAVRVRPTSREAAPDVL